MDNLDPQPQAAAQPVSMAALALPSIRAQVSRALLVLSALSALGVALAVWFSVRHEVGELLDDSLGAAAELLCHAGAASVPEGGLTLTPPTAQLPSGNGDLEFAWQWLDARHALRARSPVAPTAPWARTAREGAFSAGSWLVYGRACGGGTLYVAQTVAERLEAQWEVAVSAAGAAFAAATVVTLWLARRLRRELRPLAELAGGLERWQPGQDMALPPAQRREIQVVHRAIGELAARLDRHVQDERAVAAHAAHALRTPLAGLQAQLAVAQRESGAEQQPRLARLAEATERLQQVVHALLSLFRTGSEPRPRWVALDLLLSRLPQPALEVRVRPGERIWADPDLLAAALINLLDNAQRHGAARHVDVAVEPDSAGRQCLRVTDDGRGIGAHDGQRLLQALATQGEANLPGLGLLLVDRVARAHGGGLRLRPAASDVAGPAGTVVELHWPGPGGNDAGLASPVQARRPGHPPLH